MYTFTLYPMDPYTECVFAFDAIVHACHTQKKITRTMYRNNMMYGILVHWNPNITRRHIHKTLWSVLLVFIYTEYVVCKSVIWRVRERAICVYHHFRQIVCVFMRCGAVRTDGWGEDEEHEWALSMAWAGVRCLGASCTARKRESTHAQNMVLCQK